MASVTAHTLSAVPMSTRLIFRWEGTDVRCTTPGVITTGAGDETSARISDDAAALAARRQACQSNVRLSEVARVGEREPVARRAHHEIERSCSFEQTENQRWVGERVFGLDRFVEKDTTGIEAANVETDGPRIDTNDSRHSIQNAKGKMQDARSRIVCIVHFESLHYKASANSAIDSASRTRSFFSNSLAMHAL